MPLSNINDATPLIGLVISGQNLYGLQVDDSEFNETLSGYRYNDGTASFFISGQGTGYSSIKITSSTFDNNITLSSGSGTAAGVIIGVDFIDSNGAAFPAEFAIVAQDEKGIFITPVSVDTSTGAHSINTGQNPFYLAQGSTGALPIDTRVDGTFEFDPAPFQAEGLACFVAGTRIATARGIVAIEGLRANDLVQTLSGAVRSVKWLAMSLNYPSRHPRPWEVHPVCIRADAFGMGLPERDLRVSPGHAIYVDGVLIPAGYLINGATIVQEQVEQVRYYHVELGSHDVILAEGLPCESYLDDGNRSSFANAAEFTEVHGRLDPRSWDEACAPMVAAGPQLVEVQQRLHAQAEALGWVKSDDPALRLIAEGQEIAPLHQAGNRFWFAAPAVDALTLRSNSNVLGQMMPGLGDDRRLGVALAELRIDGVPMALEDERLAEGFYPLERHEQHAWRWTNGSAGLTLKLAAPAMIEVTLAMVVPNWTRQAPELRVVA